MQTSALAPCQGVKTCLAGRQLDNSAPQMQLAMRWPHGVASGQFASAEPWGLQVATSALATETTGPAMTKQRNSQLNRLQERIYVSFDSSAQPQRKTQ
jgi:hypothetical protein